MKKFFLTALTITVTLMLQACGFSRASGPVTSPGIVRPADYRVFFQKDYRLAKYEPEKGAYAGAYVLQDAYINYSMKKFNELTGKKHAAFFRYVGYGQPFPEEWVKQVISAGAAPHIAFEPNQGLDGVKDDEYLRGFARAAARTGVPIFLRYASEMNGAWPRYTGDPEKYIQKWRLVHDVMEEEAPNVMMVWTVFTFPQKTIPLYYPGDEYVDWVGVNIYNVVYHNNDIKQKADHEDPLELLNFVYDMFGDRKPIQISEYGATHYSVTDDRDHIEFAKSKIERMYTGLARWYPRVKAIFYFDVNNLLNAPQGRKINNYAITDNEEVLNTYKKVIADAHFLTEVKENREGQTVPQLFNAKDGAYVDERGNLYLSPSDLERYLPVKLVEEGKSCRVTGPGGQTLIGGLREIKINEKSYVAADPLLAELGYRKQIDGENKVMIIAK
ncbi:glycoside hydrolase family 26 protein [Thermoanaerobacterium sp. DL9XJH110]|uniref:glycoside hydrolase family 26 protein n=1 Tax=Thermoanaerobacterium sp. DL9XJH110 TaxID=3386643 RepID=UPI003BB710A8